MSNLKDWLVKRREKFYSGNELKQYVDEFLEMVDGNAEVHEFADAIIVLEKFGLPGNVRGWLLFDRFTHGTVTAIKRVTNEFKGKGLYASTHDVRIRNLLLKIGYIQYSEDEHDYWLVYRGHDHGM
jgi:hypothetical protein